MAKRYSCAVLSIDEECGVANLVFVLDSSQSVGELNWYVIKQFVTDIVSKLTIGEDFSHVGLVIYATDVQIKMTLGNKQDSKKLLSEFCQPGPLPEIIFLTVLRLQCLDFLSSAEEIWDLPYLAGATNTGEAIKAMREVMLEGRRKDVKDIAIVLSDGQTNIVPETVQEEAQKAKDEGITVFSIGKTRCQRQYCHKVPHGVSLIFLFHQVLLRRLTIRK